MEILNQNKKLEESAYGEAVRLSNELRSKPSFSYVDEITGDTINVPFKSGFDCETAPYTDFENWLNDNTIKKSVSLFWFVMRVMVIRFPSKTNEILTHLKDEDKSEFSAIVSQKQNDWSWIGEVGYFDKQKLTDKKKLRNNKNIILD